MISKVLVRVPLVKRTKTGDKALKVKTNLDKPGQILTNQEKIFFHWGEG